MPLSYTGEPPAYNHRPDSVAQLLHELQEGERHWLSKEEEAEIKVVLILFHSGDFRKKESVRKNS